MNSLKRWLVAGFFLICALCSGAVIFWMPNLDADPVMDYEEAGYYLTEDIQWLIVGKMKQIDPEYHLVETEDEELQAYLDKQIDQAVRQATYTLDNDPNFYYQVKGQDENSLILEENSRFYATLNYDSQGNLIQEGNMNSTAFSFLYLDDLTTIYDWIYSVSEEVPEDLRLIPPHDLEISMAIPKTVQGNEGIVYESIYSDVIWVPFVMLAVLIGAGLIFLYILFVPYKQLAQVQPFQTLLSWKAEFNIALMVMAISLLTLFDIYIMGATISGVLEPAFRRYGLPGPDIWVNLVNFIVYFLFVFFVGLGSYYLKYALCSGFVRFLKEDCWIGNRVVDLVHGLKDLSSYDLDERLKTLILKGVLINTGIVLILTFIGGWFLALIYGGVSYLFLVYQANKIKKEYDKLLNRLDAIAQGDFSVNAQNQTEILPTLQEKLVTLQDDFENAIKDRTKSQNMKTELITNVSHDLKTPLTGIKNYIELLGDPDLSKQEQEEYRQRLNQYTDRLSKLIEDLFEVSKANSGNIELDTQKIDILSLVEQVLVENENLLKKKELRPVLRKEEGPIYCELDGDKTVRIFENLLSNVAKYAMPNTRVFLYVHKEGSKVVITIQNLSNTPLDFDPEDITERFVRADQSRHEEGSGLGLAIVKSFCEIQNGNFEVQLDGDVFKAIVTFSIIK